MPVDCATSKIISGYLHGSLKKGGKQVGRWGWGDEQRDEPYLGPDALRFELLVSASAATPGAAPGELVWA